MIPSQGFWNWQLLANLVILGRAMPLLVACPLGLAFSGSPTKAQIVPDTTLGAESSVVTPQAPDSSVNVLQGGATRGANLFHSFEQFSVPTGGTAYFNNPLNIQNIFSRVTGGSISNIDGLIQANGSANLFLLNPNGIIFGPNARLNIGGSFLGSTASSLNFADGTQFSATATQTTPLLTVSVPIGLQFGGTTGSIVNQSQAQSLSGETNAYDGPVGLQVPTGQTLVLVGGDVVLEGGNLTAAGGRIELGSVAGVGEVSLSQIENSWSLGYNSIDAFGNIRLESGAFVDASGEGGGDIRIQGTRLEVTQGAFIVADTLGTEAGSEVLLHATELIVLSDGALVSASTYNSGQGGNLTIATDQLIVRDGGQVQAGTAGEGPGGNLTVTASDSVEVIGTVTTAEGLFPSGLATNTLGIGTAGDLTIATGQLIVRDGGQVQAGTAGEGPGGNLTVTASDSVEVIGTVTTPNGLAASGLFTQSEGAGVAGDLMIQTGRLIIQDGAQVSTSTTSTFGRSQGGNLMVNAPDSVQLIGIAANGQFPSGLFSETRGFGAAGDLRIQTGQLIVRDGAQVSASTLGEGQGGTLAVTASESVELIGTSADGSWSSTLLALTQGPGAAGNLRIETGQLIVRDGANVSTDSSGTGTGGALAVTAVESVELIGTSADGQRSSSLLAQAQDAGAAGNLTIATGQLIVRDGALISSSTRTEGPGGNLTVNASGSVEIMGKIPDGQFISGLFTQTEGAGDAGNLKIEAGQLIVRDGALVSTRTLGEGRGGALTVTASDSVELIGLGSGLFTETTGVADAGNLAITTGQLVVQDGARASTATFGAGQGGTLDVKASDSVKLVGTSADGQFSSGLSTQTAGTGNAGNLRIGTGRLIVQDGAQASAGTLSDGRGGTLSVTTSESVELIGSGSGLSTQTTGAGAGGELTITTGLLQVLNGARVTASTSGTGQGGTLSVTTPESVTLSAGGSLSAQATADGNAGSLTIDTRQLTVVDGAEVTVSSPQGQAGNLTVIADSVLLDQGIFTAVTGKGQGEGGANITLQVQDLLRIGNESRISADALATANGGNIKIDTTFIIAQPSTGPSGSDIKANAIQGNGGILDITAQGIFGIEFRARETLLNDITASSEFGAAGEVTLNTPVVDPTQGLVTLPTNLVDASGLIAQSCRGSGRATAQEQNQFIVTGRGGLPPSPSEALSSQAVWQDLRPPVRQVANRGNEVRPSESEVKLAPGLSSPIVEAQGWVIDNKGEVVLTATAPSVTPHIPWLTQATCQTP